MRKNFIIGFLMGCILFLIAWTYTYDAATPAGTDLISSLDDRIREFKNAIQERQNVDHYWPLTGTQVSDADAGKHRQITFQGVLSADPTVSSGQIKLYPKTVDSQEELFFKDDTNSGLQITSAGTLNITSADLLGTLANNTYFTAKDAAGTSTVNLIKADTNDVAVIPNDSQTATNAAPTQTKALVNKKYVDDRDAAVIAGSGFLKTSGATVFNTTLGALNTFQDLDLSATVGANVALCFLEVYATGGGAQYFNTRPKGYSGTPATSIECASNINFTGTYIGYVVCMTDSSGILQIASNNKTNAFTVKLVCYVK